MDTKTMESKKTKVVLAFSGGADSSVLLHMAAEKFDEVYCLFFDYGQRHKKELQCAEKQLKSLNKGVEMLVIDTPLNVLAPTSSLTNPDIDTPDVREMRGEAQPKSYVAFRNMLFISYLLSYAEGIGANTVWYGAAQVDSLAGYWDGSPEFLNEINGVAALNREHRIVVEAPLLTMSKKDIILEGIRLGVKFSDTWTCYAGEEKADAYSPSSSLRLQGFALAGYIDPVPYKQNLKNVWEKNKCKKIPYESYL
jgi:7-cyano-7-deazaguanine synthase